MFPFMRILCPTDFSEPSFEALKMAGELASQFFAEIVLAHIVTPMPMASNPMGGIAINFPLYRKEMEAHALNHLKEIVRTRLPQDVEVAPVVVYGPAADEIVSLAEDRRVDLIVMATHGRSGWRHLLFGSVAEKVTRMARCPVLTVPAPKAKAKTPLRDEGPDDEA